MKKLKPGNDQAVYVKLLVQRIIKSEFLNLQILSKTLSVKECTRMYLIGNYIVHQFCTRQTTFVENIFVHLLLWLFLRQ